MNGLINEFKDNITILKEHDDRIQNENNQPNNLQNHFRTNSDLIIGLGTSFTK